MTRIHIYKSCTILSFYEGLCKFFIGPKVLVIGLFFFTFKYIFRFILTIWYELFPDYLLEKRVAKNEYVFFLSQNGKYETL